MRCSTSLPVVGMLRVAPRGSMVHPLWIVAKTEQMAAIVGIRIVDLLGFGGIVAPRGTRRHQFAGARTLSVRRSSGTGQTACNARMLAHEPTSIAIARSRAVVRTRRNDWQYDRGGNSAHTRRYRHAP